MTSDENNLLLDEKRSKNTENRSETNMCYLICLFCVISIGAIQFGYMIGSWNASSAAYGKLNGWDEDELMNKVLIMNETSKMRQLRKLAA